MKPSINGYRALDPQYRHGTYIIAFPPRSTEDWAGYLSVRGGNTIRSSLRRTASTFSRTVGRAWRDHRPCPRDADGWLPFDPILAVIVAGNILWTGSKLMRRSIGGLMDESDPKTEAAIRAILQRETSRLQIKFHGLAPPLRRRQAHDRIPPAFPRTSRSRPRTSARR